MPRRGWQVLFLSAMIATTLVAPAILAGIFPWSDTVVRLNEWLSILLWPGAAMSKAILGSHWPDPAITIFIDWIIYTVVLWPVLMVFMPS